MGMKDTKYEVEGRNLLVELCSEIDHHQVTAIANEINHYMQRTLSKNIIFDFRKLNFMDSSGIGVIIGRYKTAKILGGEMVIFSPTDAVRRIIEMSGIQKPPRGWSRR